MFRNGSRIGDSRRLHHNRLINISYERGKAAGTTTIRARIDAGKVECRQTLAPAFVHVGAAREHGIAHAALFGLG